MSINEESIAGNPGANAGKIKKEQRIEIVRQLMIRGLKTATEIQAAMKGMNPPVDLDPRTIYRYKTILFNRAQHSIKTQQGLKKTVEEMAYDIKQTFEEVARELWVQYYAPLVSPKTKTTILREIRDTASKYKDILQSLGLVGAAPQQHQFLGADGKPVDPPGVADNKQMAADFVAFIKAKYQDPLGSEKRAQLHQTISANATPLPSTLKPN